MALAIERRKFTGALDLRDSRPGADCSKSGKLSSVVGHLRRTTEDRLYSSSRRIMRLVPVFILETNNQTNSKCLPKFVRTDNASSSIKTAIHWIKLSALSTIGAR